MRARTRSAASSLLAAFLAAPTAAQVARAGLTSLRRLALTLTLCLAWSFALAPIAVAATAPAPPPLRPAFGAPTPRQIGEMLQDNERRQERQAVTQAGMQAALERSDAALARAAARSRPHAPSPCWTSTDGWPGRWTPTRPGSGRAS